MRVDARQAPRRTIIDTAGRRSASAPRTPVLADESYDRAEHQWADEHAEHAGGGDPVTPIFH
jgi:hypothetical protein